MPKFRPALAAAFALLAALAPAARAKDTGGFVVELGADTTSVETYTRGGTHIEVEQVGRAPRVRRRHFEYDFDANGALQRFQMVVTQPGAPADAPPLQVIDGTCTADSIRFVARSGANEQVTRLALPAGSVVVASSSPWVMFEQAVMRLARQKPDSLNLALYYIGATEPGWVRMRRLGRDSVRVLTDHQDLFHMHVDRDGRILAVRPLAGTGKFAAQRVAGLDVNAFAARWAAAEQAAGAMGALSTRDTVRVSAGGANLWIDYGRPAKRGRVVFGGVVPWGELWRTGANAATQFKTDRALDFGGASLPAGAYTLWTLPTKDGWKLLVNSQTGQWGTEHDAAKDVLTLPLTVTSLPEVVERFTIGVEAGADGGTLRLDWDTTRASVAFKVAPGQ